MDGIGRMPYQMPGAGGVMRSGMTPGAAMVGGMQIPGMPQAPMANMCGWEIMGGASWTLYGGFFYGPEGIFQKAGFGFGMDNLMMDMQNRSVEMCLQYMVQQSVMQTNMNCIMMMQMGMMMDRINTLEAMLRNNSSGTEKYLQLLQKMLKQSAGPPQTEPKHEPKHAPQTEPKHELEPAPQIEPQIEPEPAPQIEQQPASQTIPQTPQVQTVAPVVQPQPQKEPSKQEKMSNFIGALRREGNDVSRDTIKALARQNGVSEQDANNLITWMSEVDSYGTIDFTDNSVIKMCDIFIAASGANGNISKFSRAAELYSNSPLASSDNLNPECFDALASVAGNPEGWRSLKDGIGNISGWWGSGSDFSKSEVKNYIRSWIRENDRDTPAPQPAPQPASQTTPQTPQVQTVAPVVQPQPQKEPAKQEKISNFIGALRREGNDVSRDTIKALARQHGVSEQDANNLITWLSEVDSYGTIDFTNDSVIKMCDVFIAASGANGNISNFARASELYCNSPLARSDNLNPECFDALASVAGNPEGWRSLKDGIGNISGWWGSGSDFSKSEVKNYIRSWIK